MFVVSNQYLGYKINQEVCKSRSYSKGQAHVLYCFIYSFYNTMITPWDSDKNCQYKWIRREKSKQNAYTWEKVTKNWLDFICYMLLCCCVAVHGLDLIFWLYLEEENVSYILRIFRSYTESVYICYWPLYEKLIQTQTSNNLQK